MREIGVRERKRSLSEALRAVGRGEQVRVTVRGPRLVKAGASAVSFFGRAGLAWSGRSTLSSLRASLAPDLPGTARMVEAARLEARASIALADCFAAATADAHGVVLLTGDPELLDLTDPPWGLEDLRPSTGSRAPGLQRARPEMRPVGSGSS